MSMARLKSSDQSGVPTDVEVLPGDRFSSNGPWPTLLGLAIGAGFIFIQSRIPLADSIPALSNPKNSLRALQAIALLFLGSALIGIGVWKLARYWTLRRSPRSSIADSPEGMVTITGYLGNRIAAELAAPLSGRACGWYQLECQIRKTQRGQTNQANQWSTSLRLVPKDARPFVQDESGELELDPRRIEVQGVDSKAFLIEADPGRIAALAEQYPVLKKFVGGRREIRIREFAPGKEQQVFLIGKPKGKGRLILGAGNSDSVTWGQIKSALIAISFGLLIVGSAALILVILAKMPSRSTQVDVLDFRQEPLIGPDPGATFAQPEDPADLANPNQLKLPLGTFHVGIHPAADLKSLTRDQILQMRKDALGPLITYLKDGHYTPLEAIYGQIQPDKPWWGWEGILFHGPGEKAILGPSVRSGSILNPLALLWPSFWEQNLSAARMWNPQKVPPAAGQAFPFQPAQVSLEVVQDQFEFRAKVTSYNQELAPFLSSKLKNGPLFNVEAVNARDLGYPFVLVDAAQSTGIKKVPPGVLSTRASHYYHVGNNCGFPGGCNNLSPSVPALEGYVIESLPARLTFRLWHRKPVSFSQAADLTYVMIFE